MTQFFRTDGVVFWCWREKYIAFFHPAKTIFFLFYRYPPLCCRFLIQVIFPRSAVEFRHFEISRICKCGFQRFSVYHVFRNKLLLSYMTSLARKTYLVPTLISALPSPCNNVITQNVQKACYIAYFLFQQAKSMA